MRTFLILVALALLAYFFLYDKKAIGPTTPSTPPANPDPKPGPVATFTTHADPGINQVDPSAGYGSYTPPDTVAGINNQFVDPPEISLSAEGYGGMSTSKLLR